MEIKKRIRVKSESELRKVAVLDTVDSDGCFLSRDMIPLCGVEISEDECERRHNDRYKLAWRNWAWKAEWLDEELYISTEAVISQQILDICASEGVEIVDYRVPLADESYITSHCNKVCKMHPNASWSNPRFVVKYLHKLPEVLQVLTLDSSNSASWQPVAKRFIEQDVELLQCGIASDADRDIMRINSSEGSITLAGHYNDGPKKSK